MRVLLWTSGWGSHDIILSFFNSCIVSNKNTSRRHADFFTLIQSWQSVVHLETWGSDAFKLWWQGGSASQRSVEALCINFLHCDPPEHCAWRTSPSAHKQLFWALYQHFQMSPPAGLAVQKYHFRVKGNIIFFLSSVCFFVAIKPDNPCFAALGST